MRSTIGQRHHAPCSELLGEREARGSIARGLGRLSYRARALPRVAVDGDVQIGDRPSERAIAYRATNKPCAPARKPSANDIQRVGAHRGRTAAGCARNPSAGSRSDSLTGPLACLLTGPPTGSPSRW